MVLRFPGSLLLWSTGQVALWSPVPWSPRPTTASISTRTTTTKSDNEYHKQKNCHTAAAQGETTSKPATSIQNGNITSFLSLLAFCQGISERNTSVQKNVGLVSAEVKRREAVNLSNQCSCPCVSCACQRGRERFDENWWLEGWNLCCSLCFLQRRFARSGRFD